MIELLSSLNPFSGIITPLSGPNCRYQGLDPQGQSQSHSSQGQGQCAAF